MEKDEIRSALREDVLKRDVLEGDGADAAKKQVARASARPLRRRAAELQNQEEVSTSEDEVEDAVGQ